MSFPYLWQRVQVEERRNLLELVNTLVKYIMKYYQNYLIAIKI